MSIDTPVLKNLFIFKNIEVIVEGLFLSYLIYKGEERSIDFIKQKLIVKVQVIE